MEVKSFFILLIQTYIYLNQLENHAYFILSGEGIVTFKFYRGNLMGSKRSYERRHKGDETFKTYGLGRHKT